MRQVKKYQNSVPHKALLWPLKLPIKCHELLILGFSIFFHATYCNGLHHTTNLTGSCCHYFLNWELEDRKSVV